SDQLRRIFVTVENARAVEIPGDMLTVKFGQFLDGKGVAVLDVKVRIHRDAPGRSKVKEGTAVTIAPDEESIQEGLVPRSLNAASYSSGVFRFRSVWNVGSTSANSWGSTTRVGTASNRNTGRRRSAARRRSTALATSIL